MMARSMKLEADIPGTEMTPSVASRVTLGKLYTLSKSLFLLSKRGWYIIKYNNVKQRTRQGVSTQKMVKYFNLWFS